MQSNRERESELGGWATALMDNQFQPPLHPVRTMLTHAHTSHTRAQHAFSWDDILCISTESAIDGSCLSNADGVGLSCVALRRAMSRGGSWILDCHMNQLGSGILWERRPVFLSPRHIVSICCRTVRGLIAAGGSQHCGLMFAGNHGACLDFLSG